MQSVTAMFQNGRIELAHPVDWPDGTKVEVVPLVNGRSEGPPMKQWPAGFFDKLREEWGDEPFDRPSQGEFEQREDW